ncbi:MAG: hypothetical protein HOM55_00860, partial [Proteobacteria bacterium]|nr:hypothetical protein [Pseudomonadota bacterium]
MKEKTHYLIVEKNHDCPRAERIADGGALAIVPPTDKVNPDKYRQRQFLSYQQRQNDH